MFRKVLFIFKKDFEILIIVSKIKIWGKKNHKIGDFFIKFYFFKLKKSGIQSFLKLITDFLLKFEENW